MKKATIATDSPSRRKFTTYVSFDAALLQDHSGVHVLLFRNVSLCEHDRRTQKVERLIRQLAPLAFVCPSLVAGVQDGIVPNVTIADLAAATAFLGVGRALFFDWILGRFFRVTQPGAHAGIGVGGAGDV